MCVCVCVFAINVFDIFMNLSFPSMFTGFIYC